MNDALERIANLLVEERAAAIAADLDALERIQHEKRAALDEMEREEHIDESARSKVIEQARANTRLLRQLADLHRALVDHSVAQTYGARADVRESGVNLPRLRRSL